MQMIILYFIPTVTLLSEYKRKTKKKQNGTPPWLPDTSALPPLPPVSLRLRVVYAKLFGQ